MKCTVSAALVSLAHTLTWQCKRGQVVHAPAGDPHLFQSRRRNVQKEHRGPDYNISFRGLALSVVQSNAALEYTGDGLDAPPVRLKRGQRAVSAQHGPNEVFTGSSGRRSSHKLAALLLFVCLEKHRRLHHAQACATLKPCVHGILCSKLDFNGVTVRPQILWTACNNCRSQARACKT